ncbi:MAG: hypothetical protein JWM98_1097 [Thermoleophilia bacterium]|nr:hypothetical protein [Thermoleophilia bacterium]
MTRTEFAMSPVDPTIGIDVARERLAARPGVTETVVEATVVRPVDTRATNRWAVLLVAAVVALLIAFGGGLRLGQGRAAAVAPVAVATPATDVGGGGGTGALRRGRGAAPVVPATPAAGANSGTNTPGASADGLATTAVAVTATTLFDEVAA